MKTKIGMFVAVVAASGMALTGCSGSSSSSGSPKAGSATLRVGSTAISTLNYDKSNAGYALGLGDLVLEPLLVLNSNNSLTPWLARSWTHPKPTTYIYNIRQGVKFADGDPLTAADVVFSLDYYRKTGSANQYNFPSDLKSITATDPNTVQITLSKPDSSWAVVPAASQLGIFEKRFFEAHKSTFGQPGTGVSGTGPWQLTSLDPTTGAELTANPHYWGGQPPFSHISWKFFTSETDEALAFRAGDIDLAFPQDNTAFATTAGTKLLTVPGATVVGTFEMNVLDKPWSDVHVRRAVAYALDKPALINAYGGYAAPQTTLITSAMLGTVGSQAQVQQVLGAVPPYSYNLAKAKAEMQQSAYPNGVTATLVTDSTSADVNISQAIVAELQRIGIHAKLKTVSPDALTTVSLGKNRAAVPSGFSTYGAVSLDPGEGFDYAMGSWNATAGNWNSTNWSTPAVDQIVKEGLATSDAAQRMSLYRQLLIDYANAAPLIPIFASETTVALSSKYTWPSFSSTWQLKAPWALGIKAAG